MRGREGIEQTPGNGKNPSRGLMRRIETIKGVWRILELLYEVKCRHEDDL